MPLIWLKAKSIECAFIAIASPKVPGNLQGYLSSPPSREARTASQRVGFLGWVVG